LTYSNAESLDSNDENGKKLKQLYYLNPNPNPNHLPQMFPIFGRYRLYIQGGPQNWHSLYTPYNFNFDQFSNIIHCQNQEKICNSTIYPTTPQCDATLPCEMSMPENNN